MLDKQNVNLLCLLCLIMVFFHLGLSFQTSTYDEAIQLDCLPQKTPLYGEKWCSFNRSANELGAICTFKCLKGYILQGPEHNECILTHGGYSAVFHPLAGTCEAAFPLTIGNHGPYHLYTRNNETFSLSSQEHILSGADGDTFFLTTPGPNEEDGTVSLRLSAFAKRFVACQGKNLSLNDETSYLSSSNMWKNNASFWLHSNKFFQGFYSFESYSKPTYYIYYDQQQGASLKQLTTEEDREAASFKWEEVTS